MRKRIFCIAVLLLLSLLAACLPTPEKETVIKPSENLNDMIVQPQSEIVVTELPTRWEEELTLNDYIIRIDADISPASFSVTPVFASQWSDFSEQSKQADQVKRVLLKNTVSYTDAQKTKTEYYEEITAYAEMPIWNDAAGDMSGSHSDEQVQEYIAAMQPWIDAAPDELTFIPFDPSMDYIPDNKYYRDSDQNTIWLFSNGSVMFFIIGKDLFDAVQQPESWVVEGDAFEGEPVGTRITGIAVSEEDAVAVSDRLMQEFELGDYAIAKIEKARFVTDFTHSIVSKGYEITYARSYGTLPVTCGTIEYEVHDRESQNNDGFSRPWTEDTITIYVDEAGVRSVSWHYPNAEPTLVNENVSILSFDKIQDFILIHLRNCFSWTDSAGVYENNVRLLIDHVGLYFGTFPMKDNPNEFYYGPIWIVRTRYCPTKDNGSYDPTLLYTEYLHINAIDGSIIHYN